MSSGAGASHKQTNLLSFVLISSQATKIYWSHQHSETKDTNPFENAASHSPKKPQCWMHIRTFSLHKEQLGLLLFIALWSAWENGGCNTCYFKLSVLFSASPKFRQNRNMELRLPPAKSKHCSYGPVFFLFLFHKNLRVGIFFFIALDSVGGEGMENGCHTFFYGLWRSWFHTHLGYRSLITDFWISHKGNWSMYC